MLFHGYSHFHKLSIVYSGGRHVSQNRISPSLQHASTLHAAESGKISTLNPMNKWCCPHRNTFSNFDTVTDSHYAPDPAVRAPGKGQRSPWSRDQRVQLSVILRTFKAGLPRDDCALRLSSMGLGLLEPCSRPLRLGSYLWATADLRQRA